MRTSALLLILGLALAPGPGAPAAAAPAPPPDSLVWSEPTLVFVAGWGAFGAPVALPGQWLLRAELWTAGAGPGLLLALGPDSAAAPEALTGPAAARLAAPRKPRVKTDPTVTAFLDTLGCRFIPMRVIRPEKPRRDARGRIGLEARAQIDSTAALAGPWVTAYDAAGRRLRSFRLEVRR